jgi:hypothetical protein
MYWVPSIRDLGHERFTQADKFQAGKCTAFVGSMIEGRTPRFPDICAALTL